MTLAPLGARRLAEQVELGARALAIELVIAAQAIDLRNVQPLGAGTRPAYELVRELVPFTGEGEPLPARSGAAGPRSSARVVSVSVGDRCRPACPP